MEFQRISQTDNGKLRAPIQRYRYM